MSIPTTPYIYRCFRCGEDFWDAHVCAQDIKPVSKAQELARWHDAMAAEPKRNEAKRDKHKRTSEELRRLEAEVEELREFKAGYGKQAVALLKLQADNAELLEALKQIEGSTMSMYATYSDALEHQQDIARAAIQKHGGGV